MFCKFGVLRGGRIQKTIWVLYEFLCDCFYMGVHLSAKKSWSFEAKLLWSWEQQEKFFTDPGAHLERNIDLFYLSKSYS